MLERKRDLRRQIYSIRKYIGKKSFLINRSPRLANILGDFFGYFPYCSCNSPPFLSIKFLLWLRPLSNSTKHLILGRVMQQSRVFFSRYFHMRLSSLTLLYKCQFFVVKMQKSSSCWSYFLASPMPSRAIHVARYCSFALIQPQMISLWNSLFNWFCNQ